MFIATAIVKGLKVEVKATARFTAAAALAEMYPKAQGIMTAELVAGNGAYVETNRRITVRAPGGEWRTM